mmetsp:Transcript_7118/g.17420  ORF Transcript_7118/g.17420 Transcript_7118/m.17420 type:complete len:205 (+) Transcript_7118:910-1524(+)
MACHHHRSRRSRSLPPTRHRHRRRPRRRRRRRPLSFVASRTRSVLCQLRIRRLFAAKPPHRSTLDLSRRDSDAEPIVRPPRRRRRRPPARRRRHRAAVHPWWRARDVRRAPPQQRARGAPGTSRCVAQPLALPARRCIAARTGARALRNAGTEPRVRHRLRRAHRRDLARVAYAQTRHARGARLKLTTAGSDASASESELVKYE